MKRGWNIAGRAAGLSAVILAAAPAGAAEPLAAWSQVDVRQHDGRLDWRVQGEARLSAAAQGLDALLVRAGPSHRLASWLGVSAQVAAMASRRAGEHYVGELRFELDPTLRARLGPVALSDRNRLEARHSETRDVVLYRNQLQLAWAAPGASVRPFVAEEVFVGLLGRDGVDESRATVGVELPWTAHSALAIGYMLRSQRRAEVWGHVHTALLGLRFEGE
jgi:hypothetical protein